MEKLCSTFRLFGVSHWVLMLLAIVTATALVLVLRKVEEKTQKIVSWTLLGTMLLFVVLEFVGKLMSGGDVFDLLPLEPINVFVFVGLYTQIKDSVSWIKFGYFISLPLSVLGLFIVPNYLTIMGAWSLSAVAYFMTIGILCGYSLLKLIWSDEDLYKMDIVNSFINYIIIVAFVHIINVIFRFTTLGLHANYFGTMGEEYDVLNKWLFSMISIPFLHQLPIFVLIIGLCYILIIPFDVFKTKKDRQAQMEELVALGNLKAQQDYRKSRGSRGDSHILVNSAEKAKPAVSKNVVNKGSSGFVSVNKEVQVHKDDNK